MLNQTTLKNNVVQAAIDMWAATKVFKKYSLEIMLLLPTLDEMLDKRVVSNIFSHLLHARHSKILLRCPLLYRWLHGLCIKVVSYETGQWEPLCWAAGILWGKRWLYIPIMLLPEMCTSFPFVSSVPTVLIHSPDPSQQESVYLPPCQDCEIFKVKEFVSLAPSIMLLPFGSLTNMHSKIKCKG